mmetsp:Transcript_44540/g.59090  ORF Transcript_44540/g.59090 Transcript_44540/m.59090 type:complete len:174 (+) Transcript_44540:778-1299(+)
MQFAMIREDIPAVSSDKGTIGTSDKTKNNLKEIFGGKIEDSSYKLLQNDEASGSSQRSTVKSGKSGHDKRDSGKSKSKGKSKGNSIAPDDTERGDVSAAEASQRDDLLKPKHHEVDPVVMAPDKGESIQRAVDKISDSSESEDGEESQLVRPSETERGSKPKQEAPVQRAKTP